MRHRKHDHFLHWTCTSLVHLDVIDFCHGCCLSACWSEAAWLLQEAEADNRIKCEAVAAVGRLVAFQSLAAEHWLGPTLLSYMVSHGKQVCIVAETCVVCCEDSCSNFSSACLQHAVGRHGGRDLTDTPSSLLNKLIWQAGLQVCRDPAKCSCARHTSCCLDACCMYTYRTQVPLAGCKGLVGQQSHAVSVPTG